MPNFLALFFLILVILNACTPSTQPEDVGVVSEPSIPLSSVERIKRQLPQIAQLKYPNKNTQYLSLVGQLFDEMLSNTQGEFIYQMQYRAEDELIKTILQLIDKDMLTIAQKTDYFLAYARYFTIHQQLDKTELLLSEDYSSLNRQQKIIYYRLRAQLFQSKNEIESAVKSLIQIYLLDNLLLSKSSTNDFPDYYLVKIWQMLLPYTTESLQHDQNQDNLANDNKTKLSHNNPYPINFSPPINTTQANWQYVGWLQLIQLVNQNPRRFALEEKIRQWKFSFPNHMANSKFISQQIVQRFEDLIAPTQIAVLLPSHKKIAQAANMIKDGILAAHYQQSHNNDLIIKHYDTSKSESIWPIYQQAVSDGANIIIGPLQKKFLDELIAVEDLPVITLALNNNTAQISKDAAQEQQLATINLYQFSLKPEDEVLALVNKARQTGFTKAAIFTPDSKWGYRMQEAFKNSWINIGGEVVAQKSYQTKKYDFAKPITSLLNVDKSYQRKKHLRPLVGRKLEFIPRIRHDVELIFLAAHSEQAKQIPLQINFHHASKLPIYATSHIIKEAFNRKENKYLEGITFTEMPWLIDPSISAISRINTHKSVTMQRLFTFGVDSYLILPYLKLLKEKKLRHLQGESGILSISQQGIVKHQITFAKMIKGRAKMLQGQIKIEAIK